MSEQNSIAIAEAYYTAFREKNLEEIGKYLHPHVEVIGPSEDMTGKDAVLEGAVQFFKVITNITIRSKFGSEGQAMLVLEYDCPLPIGFFRAASLVTLADNLISRIELFYDARPFEK